MKNISRKRQVLELERVKLRVYDTGYLLADCFLTQNPVCFTIVDENKLRQDVNLPWRRGWLQTVSTLIFF